MIFGDTILQVPELHGCRFDGALILGARFDYAELNESDLSAAADWTSYTESNLQGSSSFGEIRPDLAAIVHHNVEAGLVLDGKSVNQHDIVPLRAVPQSEPAPDGVRLIDLKESMCQWPIGDPMEEGFHFCGRRKAFGVPYCEHHAAIAYNPTARKRDPTTPERHENEIAPGKTPIEPAFSDVRRYTLKDKPNCAIVFRTGHMKEIKDVDAWVNSETTDMEMDRFTAKSVSAYIRYAGALKDDHGRIVEDTIADALKGETRKITEVGDVYCTTSGRLRKSHKVKRLFHVAAVHGVINKGTHVSIAEIEPTTRKVLDAIERRNKKRFRSKCVSVLLPMFGTGEAGLPAEDAVRHMLRGILSFFHDTEKPILQEVHISAFQESDAIAADKCLRELGGRVIPKKTTDC